MMDRAMTRPIACLLLICLLMPGLWTATRAEAAPSQLFGSRLLEADEELLSAAVLDGTAYFLTISNLYRWQPGDQEAQLVCPMQPNWNREKGKEGAFTALLSDEGRLYGLNVQTGALYLLHVAANNVDSSLHLQLDVRPFLTGEGRYSFAYPIMIRIIDGRLYILSSPSDNRDDALVSYDMQGGSLKRHKPRHIISFSDFRDGKLLVMQYDARQHTPKNAYEMRPMLLDPSTDKLSPYEGQDTQGWLPGNRQPYLYHDAARNMILAYNSQHEALIWLNAGGGPRQLMPLPIDFIASTSFFACTPRVLALDGERLLILSKDNAYIRYISPDKQPAPRQLWLSGYLPDDKALRMTMAQMENISVKTMDSWNEQGQRDFAREIINDTLAADILVLRSDAFDIESLVKKGYMAQLHDPRLMGYDAGLMPGLNRYNPQGELRALILQVEVEALTANKLNFDSAGLQMPDSFDSLLALVRRWDGDLQPLQDDYLLFEAAQIKRLLKHQANALWCDSLLGQGQPIQYDTQQFGGLMRAIDQLDVRAFDFSNEDQVMERGDGRRPLMMLGGNTRPGGDGMALPLLLPLGGDKPLYMQGRATVAGVYSRSKNAQLAEQFLSAYVANMDVLQRAALSTAYEDDIPNPNYEQELARHHKLIEDTKQRIAQTKGAQKRAFEQDLASFTANEAQKLAAMRWLVTAETLRAHHAMLRQVVLDDSLSLAQRQALAGERSAFQMLLDGALSLDQFVARANDQARLALLEAK